MRRPDSGRGYHWAHGEGSSSAAAREVMRREFFLWSRYSRAAAGCGMIGLQTRPRWSCSVKSNSRLGRLPGPSQTTLLPYYYLT